MLCSLGILTSPASTTQAIPTTSITPTAPGTTQVSTAPPTEATTTKISQATTVTTTEVGTGAPTEVTTSATTIVTSPGTITESLDMCPAGQAMSLYTLSEHAANNQFQIIYETADETTNLIDPTGAGIHNDGSFMLQINIPTAIAANIMVELTIIGADSVEFSYSSSNPTQPSPITVSEGEMYFYSLQNVFNITSITI